MKFCPECGNKLMEGVKFCPECGYKIMAVADVTTDKNEIQLSSIEKVSSEEYLNQSLKKLKDLRKDIYVTPDIPSKKLVNAAKCIAEDINPQLIIGLIDTSIFSNGKEGVVITGTEMFLPGIKIEYEKFQDCRIETVMNAMDSTDNPQSYEILKISLEGEAIEISSKDINIPLGILHDILIGIKQNVDTFENSNQMVQLSDLKDDTICAYLKIAIDYLKADDGIIDAKEYKELISLISRIKVSKDVHKKLQEYRFSPKEQLDFRQLIDDLFYQLKQEHVSVSIIYQALFMDLLLLRKEQMKQWKSDETLVYIQHLLNINDKQIEFIIRRIEFDEQIVTVRLDDKTLNKQVNELAAIASGAGVSLGALAVTGSTMGFGMSLSGGLLSLAVGGGLSGLALIAGAGFGVYKGVKYFTGTNQMESYGIRISALKEKITRMEAANIYILEDINYLGKKLSDLVEKFKESEEITEELFVEIQKCIASTQQVSESGGMLEEESEYMKKEIWFSNLPEKLDVAKFEELVDRDPNKIDYQAFIFYIYDKDEFQINEDHSNRDLEMAYEILTNIGYFDTTASAVAQTKTIAKKGFGKIKKEFWK